MLQGACEGLARKEKTTRQRKRAGACPATQFGGSRIREKRISITRACRTIRGEHRQGLPMAVKRGTVVGKRFGDCLPSGEPKRTPG